MLEKSPDHADHSYIVTDTRQPRPEAASTPHDQIYLDACLRRLVEHPDDALVHEGVHLEDDATLFAFARMIDLASDEKLKSIAQIDRCHQYFAIVALGGVACQIIKKIGDIGSDIIVAGKKPYISLQMSSQRIVVARTQVHIAFDRVALFAHHQRHLAVDLETHQTIDDMHALGF